jgi:hypothetical protein
MIRDIALSKYPHEVRLAVRWAARFLTRIDPPDLLKRNHARFVRALEEGRAKLEDRTRHEVLSVCEEAALRITIDFARTQLREAQKALGKLRLELRQTSRALRGQVGRWERSAG